MVVAPQHLYCVLQCFIQDAFICELAVRKFNDFLATKLTG
jgi:hypothetical protein